MNQYLDYIMEQLENVQDKRKVCCRGLIKKNSTMIVQSK